eukprot:GGOE01049885.1.p2 GENE.GGOE01049885.1~~GGOE01049885.1.p2  ORF type:complete len:136 (-),score=34.36 GGOE01049885.1:282-656(-)
MADNPNATPPIADRSRHLTLLQQTDDLLVTLLGDAAATMEALSDSNEASARTSAASFLQHLHSVQANLRRCIADLPDASLRFARDPLVAENVAESERQRLRFYKDMVDAMKGGSNTAGMEDTAL